MYRINAVGTQVQFAFAVPVVVLSRTSREVTALSRKRVAIEPGTQLPQLIESLSAEFPRRWVFKSFESGKPSVTYFSLKWGVGARGASAFSEPCANLSLQNSQGKLCRENLCSQH